MGKRHWGQHIYHHGKHTFTYNNIYCRNSSSTMLKSHNFPLIWPKSCEMCFVWSSHSHSCTPLSTTSSQSRSSLSTISCYTSREITVTDFQRVRWAPLPRGAQLFLSPSIPLSFHHPIIPFTRSHLTELRGVQWCWACRDSGLSSNRRSDVRTKRLMGSESMCKTTSIELPWDYGSKWNHSWLMFWLFFSTYNASSIGNTGRMSSGTLKAPDWHLYWWIILRQTTVLTLLQTQCSYHGAQRPIRSNILFWAITKA